MELTKVISHDGIARFENVRQTLDATQLCSCDWCGRMRMIKRPGDCANVLHHARLFKYGIRPDDSLAGRISWTPGKFCSVDCWRQSIGG